MLPKWIINILSFYHLFGFSTIQTRKSISVLLVHIILCSFASFTALATIIGGHAYFDQLDFVNFLLYYVASVVTYWLIIYDSCTNRRVQFRFWTIFDGMNQNYWENVEIKKGIYLTGLIALLLIDIFAFGLSFDVDKTPVLNKMLHYFFLAVFDIRIFFYILHLKLITFQLRKIEVQLKHLKGKLIEKRIRYISNQYRSAYEMSDCVNTTFSWSQICLILLTFYTSVTFLNIAYRLVSAKLNKNDSGK